ncbi:MAG: C4-dicarboxylate ABC transporter [Gammaproteobacteria bacterium]|nr:C4-dicarboxylate ABC transporter [Gammaproteobacteria bacterium]
MHKLLSVVLLAVVLAVPAQAKTLKVATISPDGLGWIKKLRVGMKEVQTRTDGRVKFKLYPGGVQGDDSTVLRKMRIGQLHGGAVAAGTLTRFYPDLQLYNLPLQFRTFDEVDGVRQAMDAQIISGLADNGIFSFSLIETGFAYVLSNTPVRSIEDLRKVKAWVPDGDPISVRILSHFDVSPIPLAITDVLAGLQTGLIDAVAVPPLVAIALQWHNQVKYVTDMPVMYVYSTLALDKKSLRGVSAPDQAVMTEVLNQVLEEVDQDNRKDNLKAFDALLASGIERVPVTGEALDRWRAVARQSIEDLTASGDVSGAGVTAFDELLQRARANSAQASLRQQTGTGE